MFPALMRVYVLLSPVALDIAARAFIDPGLGHARCVVMTQTVKSERGVPPPVVFGEVHGPDNGSTGFVDMTIGPPVWKRRGRSSGL